MSLLVVEQGTIVDRIDFNIELALTQVKQGKKHLIEAKKHSESNRAKSCMCCLVSFIIVFAVIYILKHT